MEIFMNLLLMLGGVAVFMYGMKQMSEGMEQSAGAGVRNLFRKISKNRIVDYGVGIGATAIVQSSSATSIMTVGLANTGIVTVKQGAGMVLGAKVGTTLTAFLFAFGIVQKGDFSVSALFSAVAFVGIIIIYTSSNDSLNKLALFFLGFGMLFIGLEVMEFAIGGKDSVLSQELSKIFRFPIMHNPVLLVFLGILFTSIIQSSTAASGVFIAFLSTGVISTIDQSFFLVMGANIGTCSDGLMASIGTNANGKRIAIFHVLTSTIGAALFFTILMIFRTPIIDMFHRVFAEPAWSLATYNLVYNSIYTLIILIFLNPLVDFVCRIVKDKKEKVEKGYQIDERMLTTPVIAISQALIEVSNMMILAKENFDRAFDGLINADMSQSKQIANCEYQIDDITRKLASFFIKLVSTPISLANKKLIGGLHHVINDIERIGDHAVDFARETNYMKTNEVSFLDKTIVELKAIREKISELYFLSLSTFETRSAEDLKKTSAVYNEISDMVKSASAMHIQRLGSNMYPIEVSKSLYSVLNSLQRVSDHLVNIAFSIQSYTGSKTEAFKRLDKKRK